MKTKRFFFGVGLTTLVLALTGCVTSEDDGILDPAQERGVVKTEFTISLPQQVTGLTRMSEATVQGQMEGGAQKPTFRGIQDIKLYPLNLSAENVEGSKASTNVPKNVVLLSGTVATYGASAATSHNAIASSGALNNGSNSHLYKNVEIPVGTKSFIFYGEGGITASSDYFTDGKLNPSLTGKLSEIEFGLEPIRSTNDVTNNGQRIANYMTTIAKADGWKNSTVLVLASLYKSFTSITAGSWKNVKAAVEELYKSIYKYTTSANNDDYAGTEARSKADLIAAAILNTTFTNDNNVETKFVKNVNVETITVNEVTQKKVTLTFTEDANLGSYPEDMKLPDGAAQLFFNTSEEFEPVTATGNTGMNVAGLNEFAYPVPLYYWVLSDISVSNESKKDEYTKAANDTWAKVLETYKYGDNKENVDREVTSDTRSIALDEQINYAVARLDVTIKAGSFTLKDFDGADVTAAGENFKLTGVFIGGQKSVDYKFQPKKDAKAYTIYDKAINGDIYLTTTESAKNHTLLFETAPTTKATDFINIAIELENNSGKTVIGYNNSIIYPGCKFYLVGAIKPFQEGDDTEKRAFIQDHITVANLTVKSFASAYNTLPDLRAPELELGLSVDLTWQSGRTFDIEIQ